MARKASYPDGAIGNAVCGVDASGGCDSGQSADVATMNEELLSTAAETFSRIRALLTEARTAALTAVNAAMVKAYWSVGREIVEEEQRGNQRANYGMRLLETLSKQLTAEFGKGFDISNLRYSVSFILRFQFVTHCVTN